MDRGKAYVDGFNLYHGLKQKHGRRYLWLDLEALVRRLIKTSQQLVAVDYFTARVRNQATSECRQATYLDALVAHSGLVTVVEDGVAHLFDTALLISGDSDMCPVVNQISGALLRSQRATCWTY